MGKQTTITAEWYCEVLMAKLGQSIDTISYHSFEQKEVFEGLVDILVDEYNAADDLQTRSNLFDMITEITPLAGESSRRFWDHFTDSNFIGCDFSKREIDIRGFIPLVPEEGKWSGVIERSVVCVLERLSN